MSIVDVARPHEHRPEHTTYRISVVIDEIAYRLLRWSVLFVNAQLERHPILIERAAADMTSFGKINLSEKQRQDGWHTAHDEGEYYYAYFQDSTANSQVNVTASRG